MCKRFFVEVTGLGDDGVERLVEAGVNQESILVIDDSNKLQPLINAIYSATGITYRDVCGKDRSRNVMVARLIYVHFATIAGQDRRKIMRDINKNHTMFQWYQTHYESSYQFDKQFKRLADQVIKILDSDEDWIPTRLEKIKRKRKQSRSKKKRKANKKPQVLTQGGIEEIIDRRQLKLEFK